MRRKIVAGNWKMNKTLTDSVALAKDLKAAMADMPVCGVEMVVAPVFTNISAVAQELKGTGVAVAAQNIYPKTDQFLAEKTDAALAENMEVIFCIGEVLEQRKSGEHFKVVEDQIKNALFHLPASAWSNIVLAYEPVWAIGTGETATPEQAQQMHAHIRGVIASKYGKELAEEVSILYGGSCNPSNAASLFAKPDVDGGLIGGASLKAADFKAIIMARM